MAEYYLIGALVSITFALLAGIVVRAIQGGGDMKKIFLLRKSLLAGILEEEARENSYNLNFVIDR